MSETSLQIIKEISSNVAVIVAALIGAVITIITAHVQAKWKFKENNFALKQTTINEYFESLYSFLGDGIYQPARLRNSMYSNLKTKESYLLPFLKEAQQKELIGITFDANYGNLSICDARIASLSSSLRYHRTLLEKIIYVFDKLIKVKSNFNKHNAKKNTK
jgi:type III secretory pathway component EscS